MVNKLIDTVNKLIDTVITDLVKKKEYFRASISADIVLCINIPFSKVSTLLLKEDEFVILHSIFLSYQLPEM